MIRLRATGHSQRALEHAKPRLDLHVARAIIRLASCADGRRAQHGESLVEILRHLVAVLRLGRLPFEEEIRIAQAEHRVAELAAQKVRGVRFTHEEADTSTRLFGRLLHLLSRDDEHDDVPDVARPRDLLVVRALVHDDAQPARERLGRQDLRCELLGKTLIVQDVDDRGPLVRSGRARWLVLARWEAHGRLLGGRWRGARRGVARCAGCAPPPQPGRCHRGGQGRHREPGTHLSDTLDAGRTGP
mmetsp:Transcript_18269/g.45393  ORF Transcript_18269/g.45393 Transcript_18269/m.45393 type:complete len:245 (+) Transcript_18269:256-990(+)